jgi:hypothetical protein
VTSALPVAWRTDEHLAAAREHFAARIPGWQWPAAYGVARVDDDGLVFGHVNEPGRRHRLPAVVLAAVCGHTAGTATYDLSAGRLQKAVELLGPAEAAVHWDHPNLWSWRELLSGAGAYARFAAVFVGDPDDPPADERDAAFRRRLPA